MLFILTGTLDCGEGPRFAEPKQIFGHRGVTSRAMESNRYGVELG